MNKVGFSKLLNNQSDIFDGRSQTNSFISVRVTDIILDEEHPKFEDYGAWSGIGTIECEAIQVNEFNKKDVTIAKPFYSNFKNFPLINEIVFLISLPTKNLNTGINQEAFYYFPPISIWNHPHHNAYPSHTHKSDEYSDDNKDYQLIEGGSVKISTDNSREINLNSPRVGGTFEERVDVNPLLPFPGDVIFEGRFGNSIRLGNTANNGKNNWSDNGSNGNPLLILRNGNSLSEVQAWVPMVEDINKDKSSLYLTSNQTIPLNSEFTSFPAISGEQPTAISAYNNSQIIGNSSRVVLNSTEDGIILGSNKYISLSSIDDIGLFSRKGNITLRANNLRLGGINANEDVILGSTFLDQFENLLQNLSVFCESLSNEPNLEISATLATSLKRVSDDIVNLKKQGRFSSKVVKTV